MEHKLRYDQRNDFYYCDSHGEAVYAPLGQCPEAELGELPIRYSKHDMLTRRWRAQPNNLIGGWCVTPDGDERTPADGALEFADFMVEAVAVHVVKLHNESLEG